MNEHAVIICGSRDWTDEGPIREVVMAMPQDSLLVTGGAPGADAIAHRIATHERLTISRQIYPADWNRHGRAAGPIRNGDMLQNIMKYDTCEVFAFRTTPDSRGTNDMIRQAERAGVKVTVVDA